MRPTVLVVDDYLPARRVLCLLLEPHARCLEARSTREAARMLRTEVGAIDLIMLDLGMPRQAGGLWLVELWKSSHPTPVIAMSSLADPSLADWSLRAGAVAHLRKPFCEIDLKDALAAATGRRDGAREIAAAQPAA